jgi:hypothetical protein
MIVDPTVNIAASTAAPGVQRLTHFHSAYIIRTYEA